MDFGDDLMGEDTAAARLRHVADNDAAPPISLALSASRDEAWMFRETRTTHQPGPVIGRSTAPASDGRC